MTGELSRRQLLAGSGLATAGLIGAAAVGVGIGSPDAQAAGSPVSTASNVSVRFFGEHQAGIATPEQARLVFAAFDVTTSGADGLRSLLATWTRAAARLTAGEPVDGVTGQFAPPPDTGEALGLPPSSLTITVGFGPTLFDSRFGLSDHRPEALVDLPPFAGDALDASRSGGDLCIQACADDPQVAFHAVHNLTRLALGSATLRYLQMGFGRTASPGAGEQTPRNLLGFRDGTDNLVPSDPAAMSRFVWVDDHADQPWLVGGSYLVARRIRIHLEAWDSSTIDDQEQTIGRIKASGAPLGGTSETEPVDLDALDADGLPRIPHSAHIRVASPASNRGQALLRRGYSFADGVDLRTGELDAGLFFICFQKDPRDQFIPIQSRLSANDALTQYLEHTGSGIFACPPGVQPGGRWGEELL